MEPEDRLTKKGVWVAAAPQDSTLSRGQVTSGRTRSHPYSRYELLGFTTFGKRGIWVELEYGIIKVFIPLQEDQQARLERMYSRTKGRGFPSVGGGGGDHARRVAYNAGGGRRPRWIRTSQFAGLDLNCYFNH